MQDRIPRVNKANQPSAKTKRYNGVASLNAEDYRRARVEAKFTKQIVADWIVDMVHTSITTNTIKAIIPSEQGDGYCSMGASSSAIHSTTSSRVLKPEAMERQ